MFEPSVGYLVNRAARLLRRLADRRLAPLGLSSGHLPVLTALMDCEWLSQKAIIAQAQIEQPTMAATITRMERDGIIERASDPHDGRSYRFSLTAATRAKLPDILTAIDEINTAALQGLGPDDRTRFKAMLAASIGSLEAAGA